MRIPGMRMDSPLMEVAEQLDENQVSYHENVACRAHIKVRNAYIDFRNKFDEKFPGRPYLVFNGECLLIEGDLPHGVKSLSFGEGTGIVSDIIYEFTDNELSVMAGQGLFDSRFKIPNEFYEAAIDVPVKCNFKAVGTYGKNNIPLLFANIQNNRSIEIDTENSDWAFGFEFDEIQREATEFNPEYSEFMSEQDFERDFDGQETKEVVEEQKVELEDDYDPEFKEHLEEIVERVEEKQEARNEAKLRQKEQRQVELKKESVSEVDEKEDDEEVITIDVAEFEDMFLDEEDLMGEITDSEKEAEAKRNKVQTVDRAEDLEESIEEDELKSRKLPNSMLEKMQDINQNQDKEENYFGE